MVERHGCLPLRNNVSGAPQYLCQGACTKIMLRPAVNSARPTLSVKIPLVRHPQYALPRKNGPPNLSAKSHIIYSSNEYKLDAQSTAADVSPVNNNRLPLAVPSGIGMIAITAPASTSPAASNRKTGIGNAHHSPMKCRPTIADTTGGIRAAAPVRFSTMMATMIATASAVHAIP